jgi:hypothetical protein
MPRVDRSLGTGAADWQTAANIGSRMLVVVVDRYAVTSAATLLEQSRMAGGSAKKSSCKGRINTQFVIFLAMPWLRRYRARAVACRYAQSPPPPRPCRRDEYDIFTKSRGRESMEAMATETGSDASRKPAGAKHSSTTTCFDWRQAGSMKLNDRPTAAELRSVCSKLCVQSMGMYNHRYAIARGLDQGTQGRIGSLSSWAS